MPPPWWIAGRSPQYPAYRAARGASARDADPPAPGGKRLYSFQTRGEMPT